MRVRLVRPALAHMEQALAYRQEHFDAGEFIINGSELLDRTDSYKKWLRAVTDNAFPDTVAKDWVQTDTFFAVDEQGQIVGIIDLRHELNAFLRNYGHTGYSVRPSQRRKGYATQMLSQICFLAKHIGMPELLLSVMRGNTASVRTIQKNGGVYVRSFDHDGQPADVYRITLRTEAQSPEN